MYKIRFQQNKETIIGVTIGVLVIVMAILNVTAVGSVLLSVYLPAGSRASDKTIDEATVNEAIKIIKQ